MEEKNKNHKFTYGTEEQNNNVKPKEKFVFINDLSENTINNNSDINVNEEIIEESKIENIAQKETNEYTNKNKKTIYIGYTTRLVLNIILFVVTLLISVTFIFLSLTVNEKETVRYHESGDIDYKVYLKENSFYEDEYLDKDMSYISTLIDNINATFNYKFNIEEKTNIKFKYNIIGKLIIMDNQGKNTFYQKDYVLLNDKELGTANKNHHNISEKLNINYSYYNNIANEFRNKFGVSTISKFIVTMKIKGESDNKKLKFGNNKTMSLTIPLSQREVKINLQTDSLNNNQVIEKDSEITIKSYTFLIISMVTLVISLILLLRLIKKINLINDTKSEYDKYIEKILREYDRFIANTKVSPIINDGDKVIKLNDFQELLDVRESLKVPINYYNIVSHQKCLFYLNKDNLIYEYYVKEVDLDKKK